MKLCSVMRNTIIKKRILRIIHFQILMWLRWYKGINIKINFFQFIFQNTEYEKRNKPQDLCAEIMESTNIENIGMMEF